MKISEIRLFTSNLNKQKHFYTEVLKLRSTTDEPTQFSVAVGESVLTFQVSKEYSDPYYHFAVNVPENRITEAIEWLGEKIPLIEYEGNPLVNFPNWNAHSVYFYDPAGNIVELIARHNLPNKSESVFDSGSFLNISEIGMPASSVNNLFSLIHSMMGEKLWRGNIQTFAAAGNEEGLFIIVTTKRNWFPTDKPCRIFPMTVRIKSRGAASTLDFGDYRIIHAV
jgi:catechol-2,3-dioxygenase